MPTSKVTPHSSTFSRISLVIKNRTTPLEENEFRFLIAKAIQTVHGDIANEVTVLKFQSIDNNNCNSIIKFKTLHYSRVITALILFGEWQGSDCRFDIIKTAQTPCFLSI